MEELPIKEKHVPAMYFTITLIIKKTQVLILLDKIRHFARTS